MNCWSDSWIALHGQKKRWLIFRFDKRTICWALDTFLFFNVVEKLLVINWFIFWSNPIPTFFSFSPICEWIWLHKISFSAYTRKRMQKLVVAEGSQPEGILLIAFISYAREYNNNSTPSTGIYRMRCVFVSCVHDIYYMRSPFIYDLSFSVFFEMVLVCVCVEMLNNAPHPLHPTKWFTFQFYLFDGDLSWHLHFMLSLSLSPFLSVPYLLSSILMWWRFWNTLARMNVFDITEK